MNPQEPIRSTTEISAVSHHIEENGVNLRLNIIDTPGYGDQINNDRCWDPIVKYIKDQHSAYLRRELTAQRPRFIEDTRVHCCLFFIAPTGHQLKPLDIQVLRKLNDVVNVVPVIAKSDSLTLEERAAFKQRIKQEFAIHGLRMYPYDAEDLEDEERVLNTTIANILPFAIVGSDRTANIGGRPVPVRQNKWGLINIEDEKHCEFVRPYNTPCRLVIDVPGIPPEFLDEDTSARSHRVHCSIPLRRLQSKATDGSEGAERCHVSGLYPVLHTANTNKVQHSGQQQRNVSGPYGR